jgi:hypothetical protein
MSVYVFSYDLVAEKKNPHHDYQVLWDELARLRAHRTQFSLWLVNLNLNPAQVIAHFARFVDDNDRLWATKLFAEQHYRKNAMHGTNAWLEANPPEPH